MYKKINLGLAVAVFFSVFALVLSGSCLAQGQAQQGQAPGGGQGGGPSWMSAGDDMQKAFIEAEDANKDGKVSQDEFGGPDNMFTAWDKNGDGFIELSEGPTAESMQGMMGGAGGGGEGAGPGAGNAPSGAPGSAPSGS